MEFAWCSIRIGGGSVLEGGGVVSERVIQRKGRWRSDVYELYTRNDTESASQVPSKLAKEVMGSLRQPCQDTVWGKPQGQRTASSLEDVKRLETIFGNSVIRHRILRPRGKGQETE